jgi:hypothetical protein
MTRTIAAMVVVGLAATASAAPEGEDTLRFRQHGFSIKSLRSKSNDNVMTQVVSMQMPPEGGFAANVNVQLQPFGGNIDEYVKLSKQQFDQVGFKVLVQKKLDAETVVLEYTGKMQSMDLHWYARAIRKKGKPIVYLVTGTAAAGQWAGVSAPLKECVDSIQVD